MPASAADAPSLSTSSGAAAALLWAGATLVAGVLLGAAWYAIDGVWSPLILLPAFVGAVLGLVGVGALEVLPVTSRLWAALVLSNASVAAAVVFHYCSYQAARGEFDDLRAKLLAKGGLAGAAMLEQSKLPESFGDYLRYEAEVSGRRVAGFGREQQLRGPSVYAFWAAEAAIVFGAAYALVGPATRRPFCPLCRTWRAAIRSGRATVAGLPTARAGESAAGEPLPADDRPIEFQLQSCRCGAASALVYAWNDGAARRVEPLGPDARAAALARLDGRPGAATAEGKAAS